MLLQESRRAARASSSGELILLEDQDRSKWDHDQIEEGTRLVEQALSTPFDSHALAQGRRPTGSYTIQAAIAAVHAKAPSVAGTDWAEILGLYDVLLQANPSPVIELNRAVALAMLDGPAAGLALIDAILDRGELADYRPAHRGARRVMPAAWKDGGGSRLVRAGARAGAPGTGAAIPRAKARGIEKYEVRSTK